MTKYNAAYDETTRTFSYKPYENWATRRSKEKLNKPPRNQYWPMNYTNLPIS